MGEGRIEITLGMLDPSPVPDNDNWGVASAWQTPAEALQQVRRIKAEMQRELAADFSLRGCPKHRQDWLAVTEMEKCALWHFYGVRN